MNVIITGGTKGIGRAIVELLLAEGHDIAFCARSATDINDRVESWRYRFPKRKIIGIPCDMGVRKDIDFFASQVLDKMSFIDVLINNAGKFMAGELLSEREGLLEEMIRVNLYSAYHLTRQIVPSMIDRGSGYIFNLCSVASIMAHPNGGSYSISKFALLGFSKVLREELKSKGIKVTSVLPGATWAGSWSEDDFPRERLMEANDIAISISSALKMSPSAVVEEILLRPQLGDV